MNGVFADALNSRCWAGIRLPRSARSDCVTDHPAALEQRLLWIVGNGRHSVGRPGARDVGRIAHHHGVCRLRHTESDGMGGIDVERENRPGTEVRFLRKVRNEVRQRKTEPIHQYLRAVAERDDGATLFDERAESNEPLLADAAAVFRADGAA